MIIWLGRAGFEADRLDDFKGLNDRNPWFAFLMLILMFSLAGIPPLAGFFAKFYVFLAAIGALAYAATYAPTVRDEVLAEARRRLTLDLPVPIATGVVTLISELGDAASYEAVMAAYREGRVDKEQAPAAAARTSPRAGS